MNEDIVYEKKHTEFINLDEASLRSFNNLQSENKEILRWYLSAGVVIKYFDYEEVNAPSVFEDIPPEFEEYLDVLVFDLQSKVKMRRKFIIQKSSKNGD